jgi:hypothetical protein
VRTLLSIAPPSATAAATWINSMCPRLLHIVNTCTREANYVGRLIQLRCLGSLAAVTASNQCTAIQTSAATCHHSMPLCGSACALQCSLIPPSVRRQPSQSAGGAFSAAPTKPICRWRKGMTLAILERIDFVYCVIECYLQSLALI